LTSTLKLTYVSSAADSSSLASIPTSPVPIPAQIHTRCHLTAQEPVWVENYETYKGTIFQAGQPPIQFTVPQPKQLAEERGQHTGRGGLGTTTFRGKASSKRWLRGSIALSVHSLYTFLDHLHKCLASQQT